MPASDAPLPGGLEWLFSRQRFGMKPGLARTTELLARLGHPERTFEVVLVGGTNGKGSCASTLESVLRQTGRRTALFTSPHLTHFRERFMVAGEPLPDHVVEEGLEEVRGPAEALGATFFEIVTALGCLLFSRAGVECAVMEVGLGGRFDSTNALDPRLSVITGVALDHTQVLGDTVAQIAFEKAGILRGERLGLTGATGAALEVLRGEAVNRGTTLWALGDEMTLSATSRGWDGMEVSVTSPFGEVAVQTPLIGHFQAGNVALAVVASQALGVSAEAIVAGVARTRWPGRLEPIPFAGRTFLLDGAHNPQAAGALAQALRDLGAAPVPLVFGITQDKAVGEVVAALAPVASDVTLTRATLSPRATSPDTLRSLWTLPTHIAATPQEALTSVLSRTAPGDVIAVAGSLYLIGEVRPLLLGERPETWARYQ